MNNHYFYILQRKSRDYSNLVLHLLAKYGYDKNEMLTLFNNGQVRIRWGKDWNDFTVHLTNPLNEPTWPMDELIRSIWKGDAVSNRIIMTCFIEKEGIGPVSSIAITDLYTLAVGLREHGVKQEVKNRFNEQTFLTLPFSHPSLAVNLWAIGAKPTKSKQNYTGA